MKKIKPFVQRPTFVKAIHILEQMLGPDDAMNRLRWCVPNGTSGECFLSRLRFALVALRQSFFDQLNLAIIPSRSTFDQWNVGGETHSIDVVTGLAIIQSVQDNIETFVETDTVVSAAEGESKRSVMVTVYRYS